MDAPGVFNYVICVLLMMIGFYAVIAKNNLVKKVIGLGLFQTGIFLFYISMAVIEGGQAPVRGDHVVDGVKQVFVAEVDGSRVVVLVDSCLFANEIDREGARSRRAEASSALTALAEIGENVGERVRLAAVVTKAELELDVADL